MKLVTFCPPSGEPRAGALVDDGRAIVDLAAAHELAFGEPAEALGQVLAISKPVTMRSIVPMRR